MIPAAPPGSLIDAFYARVRATQDAETKAARRRWERATLGCCPCGFVKGEGMCPVCDLGMTVPPSHWPRRDIEDALAKASAVTISAARVEPWVRPPNRYERRRARSRRWQR